jgi:outer membrane lipoprotein-sorting protein
MYNNSRDIFCDKMTNWKRLFLGFLLIALCAYCVAQDKVLKFVPKNEEQAYISKIEKASASLTTLQCSFVQKKVITILSESVISKGRLLFKKGNKLCWLYDTPYFFQFVLNGDKVFIKNEKTTNQFDTKSNALFKEISTLLVNSIGGAGLIDPKKFDYVLFQNLTDLKVQLTPKSKALSSIMNTITLSFNKSTYLVTTIEMIEPAGDSTTIVFSDVKLNQTISDESFVVH